MRDGVPFWIVVLAVVGVALLGVQAGRSFERDRQTRYLMAHGMREIREGRFIVRASRGYDGALLVVVEERP